MSLTIIQQPPIINFSGNPMPFVLAIAPYSIVERKQDLRIKIIVEVEVADAADQYTEIHDQTYYPDISGKTSIDIASITQSYLQYYVPRYNLNTIVKCVNQSRRFRLKIIIQKDGILVGDPIFTTPINVIKGGMAYEHWHQTHFFSQNIAINRQPLHFFSAKEWVGLQDKKYLYWLYPDTIQVDLQVSVIFYLANGIELEQLIVNTNQSEQYKIYCFPIGLADLKKLSGINPASFTDDVVKYTVTVVEVSILATNTVIAPQTFWVDYRNFYTPPQIVFTNSLGGMDTMRLLGDVDFAAEFSSNQAKVTTPPSGYIKGILQAQDVETDTSRVDKCTGSTDFVTKQKLLHLTDIFTAAHKFEVKDKKFIPVLINKKTVKFFNSKDSLQSLQIEWQQAFSNQYYTPGSSMVLSAICPALSGLTVVQVNKNNLQVMWACPMPYDLIEIEINNGTPAQLITLQLLGNSGSEIVTITNPAASGATAPIIIRGRVVCNVETDPVEYGPYTTVNFAAAGNTPPIANDDILILAAGYNTAQVLNGNVLSNDYDPDGDPIEAIAVVGGTTDKGGTYSLSAAGVVTYTPPNSLFNGTDSFTYACREIADPTAFDYATCFINVGNTTLGTSVYVKIQERNHISSVTPQLEKATGDFYLTFWSDPAASIPKDVTGLGLVVGRTTKKYIYNGGRTLTWTLLSTVTTPTAITGTELFFFSGEILYINYLFTTGYIITARKTEFSLEPGTGYIPI